MESITNDLNYFTGRNISSITKYKECLNKFSKDFNKEISLKTETPIFLDTNILLRYYSISFKAREKLYKFIEANKDRIILTHQVQFEFLKNREDVIQKFFEQVTNKINKDFKSEIINKITNFLDQHKIILKDYADIELEITKNKDQLEKLLKKLNLVIDSKREEHTELIANDKFLELLSSCTLQESLLDEELKLVRRDFDLLAKNISADKIDSYLNKPNSAFPGLGDIKEKPDDPYGDYIIYHEIMKFMINSKTNSVFLTFDITKGDWMNKNKSPHLHYIQNMYNNTGHIVYILDAERTLEKLLDVNIDSLLYEEEVNLLNLKTLSSFLENNELLKEYPYALTTFNQLSELELNGYTNFNKLESDLKLGINAAKQYVRDKNIGFNRIGMLKAALRIANPAYVQEVDRVGRIKPIHKDILSIYERYRIL